MKLRPYQEKAVADLRSSFSMGNRYVLFVLPTGGGKTFVFCYISMNAVERANNVLILVHRNELLQQASASLTQMGIPHGTIQAKGFFVNKPVQVASVQTLVNRMHRMTWTPQLIIVDESHHLTTASTWGKVIQYYSDAAVLGVTATPCRLDGQGLGQGQGGIFTDMIVGPSTAELIDLGHLCKPVVYAPPTQIDLSALKMRGGDFAKDALENAMDKPTITGDAIKHYRQHLDGAPSIAFCASVAHAEHVAEQFRAAGYNAASIDGTLDPKTRKQMIADLGASKLNVLTSCDIISEGTDIPIVTGAIKLRPTQSESLDIQQSGRVLRPAPGKENAFILDHVGNVYRHGLPDDDRTWSLDAVKKTKKEREASQQERGLKECPECYRPSTDPRVCPHCGYEHPVQSREIEHVEGDLTEVDATTVKRQRQIEQAKAKTLDELIEYAIKNGYKKPQRWANIILEARKEKERRKQEERKLKAVKRLRVELFKRAKFLGMSMEYFGNWGVANFGQDAFKAFETLIEIEKILNRAEKTGDRSAFLKHERNENQSTQTVS